MKDPDRNSVRVPNPTAIRRLIPSYIHAYALSVPGSVPDAPFRVFIPSYRNISPPCLRTRAPAPTFCTRAQYLAK